MPNDPEQEERINKFLAKADIPLARRHDVGWLLRNLGIRNKNLEGFDIVFELLKSFHRTNRPLGRAATSAKDSLPCKPSTKPISTPKT